MADGVRTPRTRGSLSGLALILLGAWGAVAPYAGPSFGFGFTPDHAWQSTSGRLYLSAIPGGVVVLAGLIVLATRSRGFGAFCAFIAALAGTWFIAGTALLSLLPASLNAGISTGVPLGSGAHIATLTSLALFAGLGAVIVFFAALALGRFSIVAHRDYYDDLSADDRDAGLAAVGAYGGAQAAQEAQQPYSAQQYPSQYPASTDPFPPEHYASPTEQYPAAEQYPATSQQQPGQQQLVSSAWSAAAWSAAAWSAAAWPVPGRYRVPAARSVRADAGRSCEPVPALAGAVPASAVPRLSRADHASVHDRIRPARPGPAQVNTSRGRRESSPPATERAARRFDDRSATAGRSRSTAWS